MNADETIRAGQLADERGDLEAAAAAFSSLLRDPEPRVVALARLNLGRVLWKQGQLDRALAECRAALPIAIREGDTALRAQIENAIGVVHVARAEYEQARAAYAVALDLTQDAATRGKILLNLGVIGNVQGDLARAAANYRRSLELFREAKDERGQALALHNIGMLHADNGEWEAADEAFVGAVELFERFGNRQMIANVLVNRSEVHYGREQLQDGVTSCDRALTIFAALGDETGRAEALRWKGHGLRKLQLANEAAVALREALRIAQRLRLRLLEAETRLELGRVHRVLKRPDEAREQMATALALFSELGAERESRQVREEMASL